MGAGGSAVSAIATATLLGFRNALYGLQLAPILKVTGLKRIIASQITIDESTAVSTLQSNDSDRKRAFYLTGFGVYIFWNLFTFLGALGASAILTSRYFWVEKMSSIWIAVIGSSITAFLNKYIGHSVPEKWLDKPRIKNINTLVPIVLLSALIGVQTFANKQELVIDQRLVGVGVALIALKLKASFPIVVLAAAVSSAAVYNLF